MRSRKVFGGEIGWLIRYLSFFSITLRLSVGAKSKMGKGYLLGVGLGRYDDKQESVREGEDGDRPKEPSPSSATEDPIADHAAEYGASL